MGDSSEVEEIPLSDPPQAAHPRTWSEGSASFADQLISPTSRGSGHSIETSGELRYNVNYLNLEVCQRCVRVCFRVGL